MVALDKDILVKDNKMYSESTCLIVPHVINNLFTYNQSTNVTGFPGVCKTKHNKYMVRVFKENKEVYCGLYDTPEEAFQVYKYEKEKYIKYMADKYRKLIKSKRFDKVYEALYNYEV